MRRAGISLQIRIRSADFNDGNFDEVRLTQNASRKAIYFFTQIPAQIDPGEVASVLVMAFGLSFLATLYPSWRAARLDPVEALRYE